MNSSSVLWDSKITVRQEGLFLGRDIMSWDGERVLWDSKITVRQEGLVLGRDIMSWGGERVNRFKSVAKCYG